MWQNFCQLPKNGKIGFGTSYWSIIPSLVEIGAFLEFGQCGETFASCPKWQNRTRHMLLVHYTKFGWNRSIFRIWAMWRNFCKLPKMAKSDSVGCAESDFAIFWQLAKILPHCQNSKKLLLVAQNGKIGLSTSYWSIIPSLVEIGALLEFRQLFASCPKWPNRTRHILLVHYIKFGWNRSTFRIWAMWQNFCQLPKMAKSDSAHPTGPLYQVWLKSEHF